MTDFDDFRRRYGSGNRPTVRRVRHFLSTRPTESWLFFFAGIVLGAILG